MVVQMEEMKETHSLNEISNKKTLAKIQESIDTFGGEMLKQIKYRELVEKNIGEAEDEIKRLS